MATQQELDTRAEKLRWEEVQYKWLRKHLVDFDPSPENAQVLGQYIAQYGLPLTESSLEQAYVVMVARGMSFKKKAGQSALVESQTGLPPIPKYMGTIESEKDIRAIAPDTFKKWYYGPDGAAFKARIEAVNRRARQG